MIWKIGYPILKLSLTKRRLTYRAKSSTIIYGLNVVLYMVVIFG